MNRRRQQRKLARDIGHRSDAPDRDMGFRSIDVRAATIDAENRSIEALVSTENPVPMIDWERMEVVPEILLTAGAEFPKTRQVPLLDSHNRYSVDSQLGSARELQKGADGVVSRLFFSSAAESQWTKVREGHVRDVSAGYQVIKKTYIAAGESKSIGGRSFTGPVNVVTKWRLREVSATPIGADEQAKLRGLDPQAFFHRRNEEEFAMNPELRKLLESRGMSKELSDDEAQRWFLENKERLLKAADSTPPNEPVRTAAPAALTADEIRTIAGEGIRAALKAERDEARKLDEEIRSTCLLADLPDEFAHCRNLPDLAAVRSYLAERKKKISDEQSVNPNPTVRITGDGYNRFVEDVGTAIAVRACTASAERKETLETVLPVAKRGKNWEQFRHISIYQAGEEMLRMAGFDTRGRTREEIAMAVMFGPENQGMRYAGGAAYNVTGNFLKLTQDAFAKSMMVGYTEARSTWRGPMRQGESVVDFKTVHRMRMGAIPNLPIWNDNKDPEKASFSDADEPYAVESRSLEVDFSYRLLVNDDMSALSRAPNGLGQAADRTVNAYAWSLVTANPTMSDSVSLFSAATGARKRQNLTTGAGAPSVTTVGALTALMRLMHGENTPEGNESDDVLNLQPKYIVGPAALEVTINQLVNSAYDPSSSVNNQVYNPTRVLTPVIEPILDAASTTAWYLFCSPGQCDTLEISFLQGQETPQVRFVMDEKKLAQSFIVLQTFGGKAMNHRGIQKHAGA